MWISIVKCFDSFLCRNIVDAEFSFTISNFFVGFCVAVAELLDNAMDEVSLPNTVNVLSWAVVDL